MAIGFHLDDWERESLSDSHDVYELNKQIRNLKKQLETVRAEAIKEFAERLKENISNMEYRASVRRKTIPIETLHTQVNWVFHEIVPKTIDSIVKEMTEENG